MSWMYSVRRALRHMIAETIKLHMIFGEPEARCCPVSHSACLPPPGKLLPGLSLDPIAMH